MLDKDQGKFAIAPSITLTKVITMIDRRFVRRITTSGNYCLILPSKYNSNERRRLL